LKVGFTGDIGSGKSTALRIFGEEGFRTSSTDQIVHKLLKSDESLIRSIEEVFGSEVLLKAGGVDRRKLGAIVFRCPEKRKILESLVHPKVREMWEQVIKNAGKQDVIVEIPLLFENKLEKHFDYSVTVYSSLDVKTERLKGRNLNEAAIRARLNAQLDQDSKANQSDFLILNNGTLDFLRKQIRNCILQMRKQS
jgi:dephospho-CoA kinase